MSNSLLQSLPTNHNQLQSKHKIFDLFIAEFFKKRSSNEDKGRLHVEAPVVFEGQYALDSYVD